MTIILISWYDTEALTCRRFDVRRWSEIGLRRSHPAAKPKLSPLRLYPTLAMPCPISSGVTPVAKIARVNNQATSVLSAIAQHSPANRFSPSS
ncbi:MAG: hypothetical protein AAGD25_37770 [Cyanobacteria bacterium P01_F01_bin.150]